MGYMTIYSLEIESAEWQDAEEIIKDLREGNDGAYCAINENGGCAEPRKWHSHDKDLKAFSKAFPTRLFKLTGTGEDSGDLWQKYYKDGKVQLCKAVLAFPKYDPKKLS